MNKPIPRRPNSAPTISDVAALAGVSPMTVSRVINGSSKVKPAKRDAVHEAIRALRYAPNPAAQNLAGSRTLKIGLLYSNPSASYLSEFLVGSLDQASQINAQLIIERCGPGAELDAARRLIENGVDGVLLPPPLSDLVTLADLLESHGIPAVGVATGRPDPKLFAVSIDDKEAARAMTAHLLALDHSRIAFIIGSPDQSVSAQRLAGFRLAFADAGRTVDEALVVQGLFTYRSGLDAMEQLLSLAERPTAVFASNDDMAAAAVAIAHRHGLDVPGDITVCGFDDTALATTIWPELTTVHQPIADMSRRAILLLVEAIRARQSGNAMPVAHELMSHTLVRRQSDAPPRRRPRTETCTSAAKV